MEIPQSYTKLSIYSSYFLIINWISLLYQKRCGLHKFKQLWQAFNCDIPNLTDFIPLLMTSSNGNIFRLTGPLWGEFTGRRWIPLTKASDAELWCFLWSEPEQTVDQIIERLVIWDAMAPIMTSLLCISAHLACCFSSVSSWWFLESTAAKGRKKLGRKFLNYSGLR